MYIVSNVQPFRLKNSNNHTNCLKIQNKIIVIHDTSNVAELFSHLIFGVLEISTEFDL